MKKITALVIGCSLGLVGALIAQQPEGQESPSKKGGRAEKTTQSAEGNKPTRNAPNQVTPETGMKKHGDRGERGAKTATNAESSPATGTNATDQETGKKNRPGRDATANTTAETGASASPGVNQAEQGKKGRKARGETARTSATPAASASPATATNAATNATPATGATTAAAAGQTGAVGTNAAVTQGNVGRGGKRVEKQQIQQIKQQHANFKAQPRPDKAPSVSFNANFRIAGSDRWQGQRYEAFRSYHPEWHDQGWYRQRYHRVELIGGGWYYWNGGYWYPAWGYDQSVAYYPYDGPIYVGQSAEPPDKVIADVQTELQDMGYYQGDVDGLLGPLTREALRDYQADHGLEVTEAIDEPTLDALEIS